jgi:hypothetical protein
MHFVAIHSGCSERGLVFEDLNKLENHGYFDVLVLSLNSCSTFNPQEQIKEDQDTLYASV